MADIRQINVILPEDLEAVFANVVRLSHTPGEFIMDFSSILPGNMKPKVKSRIVMSPLGLSSCSRH